MLRRPPLQLVETNALLALCNGSARGSENAFQMQDRLPFQYSDRRILTFVIPDC
jgi:hypothetical protein